MSLQSILIRIGSELGISVTNEDELQELIRKVNDVASDVYRKLDLPYSLQESTFTVDTEARTSSLISLPYYIDKLRGLRYSELLGEKIALNDMRPKYHLGKGWGENAFSVPFRKVKEHALLERDIDNASILTFTLDHLEESNVSIYVVGKTSNADQFQEKVTITAGNLSASTIGNYEDVKNIEKTAFNTYNITITDADDVELATIANAELKPIHTLIEIIDGNIIQGHNELLQSPIDILYKRRFTPFRNTYDEFSCPNCDDLLFWKFAERWEAQKEGGIQRAIAANQKASEIIYELCGDDNDSVNKEIQFGENPIYAVLGRGLR